MRALDDPRRGILACRRRAAALVTTALCCGLAADGGQGRAASAQTPARPPGEATVQPAGGQQAPTFTAGVDLVTVDVSVVDNTGRPVRGLGVEDFELKVDGEPRRIVSAQFVQQSAASGPPPSTQYSTNEGSEGGRLIMLVVDQGNIRQGRGAAYIRASERLLDDLGPGDRVAVAFIPGGRVIDFTRHLTQVRRALRQTLGDAETPVSASARPRVGIAEALAYRRGDTSVLRTVDARECSGLSEAIERQICANELTNEMEQLSYAVWHRTENTLNVLRQILGGLVSVPGPKTLVMLTEGLYIDREFGFLGSVARQAAAARVSMYAVVLDDQYADFDVQSYGVSPTSGADRQLRLEGIESLIGMTRGATYRVASGAHGTFERLARELTGYYLVAFEPLPEERDGSAHEIAVRVGRRGVEVRARREFTVSPTAAAKGTDDELLADTLRSPLTATEFPLRVVTYSFPDPENGLVRVLIGAGLGRVTDDAPVKAIAYAVTDDRGRLVTGRRYDVDPPKDNDHRWNGTVTLRPGTYTLKVAAVDADGRRASVEHQVDASLFRAGDLVVGDLMLTEHPGGDGWALRPEIEPTFGRATLGSYVEVFSTIPDVLKACEVTVEIASDANAPTLVTARSSLRTSRDGVRAIGLGEAALDPLPPGEYVARASVRLGGKPVARVLRPFIYAPTSAVIAASAAGIGGSSTAFDRSQILASAVTEHFLGSLASSLDPEVSARVEAATRGDFSALAAGAGEGSPPGVSALLRGVSLYARGELEAAATELRRALADSGELSAATFYLGACYAAGGRHKEAVGAWQTALAADDQPPFVYALTTEAFLRVKDWDGAIGLAEEASALWPDDGGIQRLRVRALAFAGRRALALEAADEHLATDPGDHEIILLAMKLLYDAHADGRPLGGATANRQKYEQYLARYRAAGGPQQALAERWLEALGRTESRE